MFRFYFEIKSDRCLQNSEVDRLLNSLSDDSDSEMDIEIDKMSESESESWVEEIDEGNVERPTNTTNS